MNTSLCWEETFRRSIDKNGEENKRNTLLNPFHPFDAKSYPADQIKEETPICLIEGFFSSPACK